MELRIDAIVAAARALDPKRAEDVVADLRTTVLRLFEELDAAGIDHVLVGGVALLAYVDGRNTQDIDLIVRPEQVLGFPWAAALRDADFGTATFEGIQVDLLLASNPLFRRVLEHERASVSFAGRTVPCATREGLLMLKLYALPSLYRQGKLARAALYEADIFMLLQGTRIADAELVERLAPHLPPHDLAEIRKIVEEQRTRKRFV